MRINPQRISTYKISLSRAWMVLFAVALVSSVVAAACGGGDPEHVEIAVSVADGKMTPKTINVKQGDTVTLKIKGDVPGEFHLHTYDVETDIGESGPVDMAFVARATGRFRITFHEEAGEEEHSEEGEDGHDEDEGGEVDLGFLEVQPR